MAVSTVESRTGVVLTERQLKVVKLATTAAITLATGLEAGDTIDGTVLVAGDLVLVKDQADAKENGVYFASTTGAPVRTDWADSTTELHGLTVLVTHGTANANIAYTQITDSPVIATDNIVWMVLNSSTLGGATVAGRVVITDGSTGAPTTDGDLLYNASTNVLTVGAISVGNGTLGGTLALSFAGSATTGFTQTGSQLDFTVNNSHLARFGGSRITLLSTGKFGWTDGTAAGTEDTDIRRKAAASVQLGTTSSGSATNQTFGAHDTTGADKTGANLTNTAGNGTGTGGSGLWIVNAAPASTTSSTANTFAALLTLSGGKNTGTQQKFIYTGQADLNLTASTEVIGVNFNLSETREYATGALALHREMVIQAPTIGFVGASTITSAATLAISGPPIAGMNATLTNSFGILVGTPEATTVGGNFSIGIFGSSSFQNGIVIRETTNNSEARVQAYSGGFLIGSVTAHAMEFRTSDVTRMTISANGTVITFGATGVVPTFTSVTATGGVGVGTLTNTPNAGGGDPAVWLRIRVNGTTYGFPGWAL